MKRRDLLAGAASVLAMPALAQNKPDKLVYVGDNGPWHYAMVEEVAPAFEKIKKRALWLKEIILKSKLKVVSKLACFCFHLQNFSKPFLNTRVVQ